MCLLSHARLTTGSGYRIELATFENTMFELLPTKRIVPTTNIRIRASITGNSAMGWPWPCHHSSCRRGLSFAAQKP
jgi:hypothetical protein